jgi:uncharacterized protein with beta-barrel porin domain
VPSIEAPQQVKLILLTMEQMRKLRHSIVNELAQGSHSQSTAALGLEPEKRAPKLWFSSLCSSGALGSSDSIIQ